MSLKHLSILALASCALAQSTPSLLEALNSTSELSQLQAVLGLNPQLVQTLGGASNISILAPSNEAFGRIPNETFAGLAANTGLLTAILQYHVLNGTVPSSAITNVSAFPASLLTNSQFTNVTGGQVVKATRRNGNVTIYSGLLSNSSVTRADVNFTGGVIHIIDRLLVLPENPIDTLTSANLSSLRGALNATNLTDTVRNTPDVTIFAPSNEAIRNIGSGLGNLTTEQLSDILTYHVVASGGVGYSSTLRNGSTLETVNGESLTITTGSGGVFVNNARVSTADILIANGVLHVIDQVLNPTNQTIANATSSQGVPAFQGASPIAEPPFTSGQPTPTTSISGDATRAADPTSPASSSVAAGAAAPLQTGAMGMGALFGAAAVYLM